MYFEHLNKTVREEIEPVITGMGFSLVECTVGRLKGVTRVAVVVHRAAGVGIDECAEVSRLIYPRLLTIEGMEDVSLEVSSPGIDRRLKSPAEYGIFAGRGVRILAADEAEWIGGVIERAENGVLKLRTGGGVREYPISSIRKARLDHSQESTPSPRGETKNEEDKNAV